MYKRLLPPEDSTKVGEIRRHHPEVANRQVGATQYSVTNNGVTTEYYRYYFMHKLDFSLAQREHPLPKDVNLRIIFYRAHPKKSLLSVKLDGSGQDLGGYSERSIPFINPMLQVKYAESKKYDKKYSTHRISRVKFPFLTKTVRREVLQQGIANFKFTIANGRLPIALCFAFTKPDNFDGMITEPLTNFKSYGIRSFDLILNSRSLSGYPLRCSGSNMTEFYFHFLEQCNFWRNTISTGPMNYDSFQSSNFIIVDNLKRRGLSDGQLNLNIEFNSILQENYLLLIMPMYQQILEFDEHLNCQMRSSSATEADRADERND